MTPQQFVTFAKKEFGPAKKLFALVPEDKLDWKPAENMFTLRQLIHHLADRTGAYGLATGDFSYKSVMDGDDPAKTTPAIAAARLDRAIGELEDMVCRIPASDWESKVITRPWGWKGGTVEEIAHGLILNHFLNHKMQLFLYLKLLGQPVNTETLYP